MRCLFLLSVWMTPRPLRRVGRNSGGDLLGVVKDLRHHRAVLFRIPPQLRFDNGDSAFGTDIQVVDRTSRRMDFPPNGDRWCVQIVEFLDGQQLGMRVQQFLEPRFVLGIVRLGFDAGETTPDIVWRVHNEGIGSHGRSW
jgi:hypothetical protein